MTAHRRIVICHFRNEEIYLPYWLRHHMRLFDRGIMIDHRSSDRSIEIIRDTAPTWAIRPSRNEKFHSVLIDAEVMDIESGISEWKMCLNVAEFLMHDDLYNFVADLERTRPELMGLVTTGFIIQDSPEQIGLPLIGACLWPQQYFGCPEPDPFHNVIDCRRLVHKAARLAYGIGRHSNGVSRVAERPLYLILVRMEPT